MNRVLKLVESQRQNKKTTCESKIAKLFHDNGLYHIETSSLICRTNQWTGFYMIGTSAMKELILNTA